MISIERVSFLVCEIGISELKIDVWPFVFIVGTFVHCFLFVWYLVHSSPLFQWEMVVGI